MGRNSREKKEKRISQEKKEVRPDGTLEKICVSIITFATYLVLFTPLIVNGDFFFPFVGPKSLFFMALVQIIFFTWLFLIFHSKKYRPRFNLVLAALLLYLVVVVISSFLGANPSYSFWSKFERMTGLLMWINIFAFFLVLSSVFKKREDWEKVFCVSLLVALIAAFISVTDRSSQVMRGGGTIGNDSFLGTYLLLSLALGFYLFFTSKRDGIKIYSAVCIALILLILVQSGARAAKISFWGGIFLLALLYFSFYAKKKAANWLGRILLVLSVIFFIIAVAAIFQPGNFIYQKFVEMATKARLVVWEASWKGFLERPWFGWGLENFEVVFTKYFNPCLFLRECGGEVWFDRSHNIIFDVLVANGALGMISYGLIFLAVFYVLWKGFSRKKIDFWMAGIFSVFLIAYLVQNLTVFDMVNSYLVLFLIIACASALASQREEEALARAGNFNPLVFLAVLILFGAAFLKFSLEPFLTDRYIISAIQSQPFSDQRFDLYQKTLQTSQLGKYQNRGFFAETTLSGYDPSKAYASLEKIKREFDFVASEMEKSIKDSPLDFRTILRLGQVYNTMAYFDQEALPKAEKVLDVAIQVSPANQQAYWALTHTKILEGKYREAADLAEKSVQLDPRVERSHLVAIQAAHVLSQVEPTQDNQNFLQDKIKRAVELNPALQAQIDELINPQPAAAE